MESVLFTSVIETFNRLGYEPWHESKSKNQNEEIWLVNRISSDNVKHYATLRYKPRARMFGVGISTTSPIAIEYLKSSVERLRSFMHPGVAEYLGTRPSWTAFNPGIFLKWDYVALSSDGREMSDQVDRLGEEYLDPFFFNANSTRDVMNLLLRTDGPFLWEHSNAVIRAAEVMALANILQEPAVSTRDALLRFKDNIERDMTKTKSVEDLLTVLSFN